MSSSSPRSDDYSCCCFFPISPRSSSVILVAITPGGSVVFVTVVVMYLSRNQLVCQFEKSLSFLSLSLSLFFSYSLLLYRYLPLLNTPDLFGLWLAIWRYKNDYCVDGVTGLFFSIWPSSSIVGVRIPASA